MIYRFERGYSNEYMIPEVLSEELLYEYFTFIINSGRLLSDNIYSLYPKNYKRDIIVWEMDNKDLIKQYIDTGFKIPEYQVIKLSNNDKKTYIVNW
jgi:hypothetical protein